MKRVLIILIGLLVCMESFSQLGYRYEGKFIRLTPTTEKRYFVQTQNTETKEYLQKETIGVNQQGSNEIEVYQISENKFFVSSTANLMDDDYISEEFVDSMGNPYYILPRITTVQRNFPIKSADHYRSRS